ncbi:MAG: hypothetical protein AB7U46_11435 [Paenirhodobacter sp.]|uniref:hypothetical protein n=1 Tax=Paenirhodobacter sp. TaxID=1965326 RepID=UPI003D0F5FDB
MRIIFLEERSPWALHVVNRLSAAGHEVLHTARTAQALQLVRLGTVDMVIATLFPGGAGSGEENGVNLALAAQFRNPDLVTILLSDSALFSGGELFEMLFSLRCVLPRPAPVEDLLQIATHFLDSGPVDCVGDSENAAVCNHCLLTDVCAHAEEVRQQRLCA